MLIQDRNIVGNNGILSSSVDDSWEPATPNGSFYRTLISALNGHLEEYGDWTLYRDILTNDVFMASEFEPAAKK